MRDKILFVIFLLIIAPFIINGISFLNCDFESDYKCEVIHGIGVLVPPASYITVWFDSDD